MWSRWLAGGLTVLLCAGLVGAGDGVWPVFKQGLTAYQRGDLKVAQQRMESVLVADPNFGDAYYYLGVIQDRRGNRKAAVATLKKVGKKWSSYSLAQERLGQIARHLGDLKSAEHYFKTAAEVRPTVNAWLQVASVQLDLKMSKEAEETLAKAEKLSPKDLNLQEMKARLFVETKRFDKALECYDAIVKAMPRDASSIYMRSLCLIEMERVDEAVEGLEQVLKVDPFHEGAIRRLLAVYEDDSSKEERVAELERRLEMIKKRPARVRPRPKTMKR